jgi:hypothetical protein
MLVRRAWKACSTNAVDLAFDRISSAQFGSWAEGALMRTGARGVGSDVTAAYFSYTLCSSILAKRNEITWKIK